MQQLTFLFYWTPALISLIFNASRLPLIKALVSYRHLTKDWPPMAGLQLQVWSLWSSWTYSVRDPPILTNRMVLLLLAWEIPIWNRLVYVCAQPNLESLVDSQDQVFRALQNAYIQLLQNPFYYPDNHVPIPGLAAGLSTVSQPISNPKFIADVKRIGETWSPGAV